MTLEKSDTDWLAGLFQDAGFRLPHAALQQASPPALAALREAVERETATATRRLAALARIDAEYRVLAARYKTQLAAVGLSRDVLSASGRTSLRALADTASALEASSCRAAPLAASLAGACRRGEGADAAAKSALRRRRAAENGQAEAEAEREWALELLANMRAAAAHSSAANGPVAASRLRIAALRRKQEEYTERLAAAGPKPATTHEKIVGMCKELSELESREKEAQARLQALSLLPSDMVLAEVRVSEKEEEVKAAEEEVSRLMQQVGANW